VRILLSAFTVLLAASTTASAQSGEEAVMATVNRLFDGMKAADSAMARSTFHPQARLQRAGINRQTGEPELSSTPVDGFIGFIGGIEPGQAEEPIWDAVVQIDDRLATVWVKYELIFNGEFHHCGVDAFELWRSNDGWKIFQLTDTSRTEDCWHQP
jgi:hypothetical protein